MTDFPSSPDTESLINRLRSLADTLEGGSGKTVEISYADIRCAANELARLSGHAKTPDLEATVNRIMRIRNGMILDGDAEALIRKEIGAVVGGHAQRPKEPVAWRYQGRVGWGDVWRLSEIDPTKTEGFFESPEGWVVQPLFASPDTSTDREARETELPYLKGGLDGY
jgi:hypothetical protein